MSGGYLFGAGAVLLFWLVSSVITERIAPWALAVTDSVVGGVRQKELSASKLQALVWTYVTLFAYGSVFGAFMLDAGSAEAVTELPKIPIGLLVLMGLSVTTAASAKGVTVSYKAEGRISQRSGGAVTTAQNQPDLVKAQMLVWTFIGAGYYLLKVVNFISNRPTGSDIALPDLDGALLVLLGAAQGAYVGDKLVSRDIVKTPKLNEIAPPEGPAGTEVTLLGENFGVDQGQNFVRVDDILIRDDLVWSDYQIQKVVIPTTFRTGRKVGVRVCRDGEYSEVKRFTVT